MKILLILLALLAGLVYIPFANAITNMTPWQLFQYLCSYVSPGSPQCIQQLQQAITPWSLPAVQQPQQLQQAITPWSLPAVQQPPQEQQQSTTAFCNTCPSYAVSQQQPQQQAGPPPDGPPPDGP